MRRFAMLQDRSLFGAAICLALAVAVVGCSGGDKTDTSASSTSGAAGTATKTDKPLKLAFVTNNSSDYWTIAHKGVEKAQKEFPNDTIEFQMPPSGTPAEQKQIVDDLLVKGIDGIAISPSDPKTQTEQLDKWAAQTLLITQDSDAPQSKRACYIGTDNVAAGREVGQELLKALPNGGKIVAFVGMQDAQNAQDRINGIKDAIKGSKVELVDVRTDNTDHLKAKSNAADVLVSRPDVVGLVGIWSYNGPAIAEAVKEAGKVGKIKIVCFDEEPITLAGVKDGTIYATVVQHPFDFGYLAIKKMHDYLNGDKSAFPANGLNIIATSVLHAADVDAFKANLDKIRNG
jgi:ribose transport system substrate-binding protein